MSDSGTSPEKLNLKSLLIKGVVSGVALAGTTAIPIVVQQSLQSSSAPTPSPTATVPAAATPSPTATVPAAATPSPTATVPVSLESQPAMTQTQAPEPMSQTIDDRPDPADKPSKKPKKGKKGEH